MKNKHEDKILVTGAGGFIGSHLVEYLVSNRVNPKNLKLLVFNHKDLKNLPKLDFKIFLGDITDKKFVKKVVRGVDVIYHLAALSFRPGYNKKDYFEVNVEGTRNILEALEPSKIKKFVFFSSVAVYGLPICKGDMVDIDEHYTKRPCEEYGESKLAAEKLVIVKHKNSGLHYAIVRPTTVYGPRDHQSFPSLIRMVRNHLFFVVGGGQNRLDFVYVDDLIRGARLAEVSERKSGDYIFGGGTVSLKELGKTLSSVTKSWILPFGIPKWLALFISYFTDILGLPLYPNRVRSMTSNFYFNFAKARRELGYKPTVSFNEGCRITNNWMEKVGLSCLHDCACEVYY